MWGHRRVDIVEWTAISRHKHLKPLQSGCRVVSSLFTGLSQVCPHAVLVSAAPAQTNVPGPPPAEILSEVTPYHSNQTQTLSLKSSYQEEWDSLISPTRLYSSLNKVTNNNLFGHKYCLIITTQWFTYCILQISSSPYME